MRGAGAPAVGGGLTAGSGQGGGSARTDRCRGVRTAVDGNHRPRVHGNVSSGGSRTTVVGGSYVVCAALGRVYGRSAPQSVTPTVSTIAVARSRYCYGFTFASRVSVVGTVQGDRRRYSIVNGVNFGNLIVVLLVFMRHFDRGVRLG